MAIKAASFFLASLALLFSGQGGATAWGQEEIPGAADWSLERPAIRVAVRALSEVIVSSRASGAIKTLAVEDGGRFKKGETLMELDCGVLAAQAARAKAQAKKQKLIHESNERLSKMNSKSALEVAVSRTEAEAAEAEALSMEKMAEQCRFTAPFDGRVGEVMVKENQYVMEGQPVMEILDDSRLVLEFIVPSSWVEWLEPGHEFFFTIDETGKNYRAAVSRLGGRVDPVSQSIRAYADPLDSTGGLMPGMSGEAAFLQPAEARKEPAKDNPELVSNERPVP